MEAISDGTWDLVIAHPPCTHLAVSGARYFKFKQKEQAIVMAGFRGLDIFSPDRSTLELIEEACSEPFDLGDGELLRELEAPVVSGSPVVAERG